MRAVWRVSFWPGQICGPMGPPGGPVCPPTWRSRERSKLDIKLRVTSILKRETCNCLPHTQGCVVHCCDMGPLASQLSCKLSKEKAAFSNSWACVIWKRELELPVLGKTGWMHFSLSLSLSIAKSSGHYVIRQTYVM